MEEYLFRYSVFCDKQEFALSSSTRSMVCFFFVSGSSMGPMYFEPYFETYFHPYQSILHTCTVHVSGPKGTSFPWFPAVSVLHQYLLYLADTPPALDVPSRGCPPPCPRHCMSLRYSVYRAHDETSDVLRCCFQRKAKQDSSEAMELRRLLSEHFFVVLMRTPYSDIEQAFFGVVPPGVLSGTWVF